MKHARGCSFLLELRPSYHWSRSDCFIFVGLGVGRDLILYPHWWDEQKEHREVDIKLFQKGIESFIRENTHTYVHMHHIIL